MLLIGFMYLMPTGVMGGLQRLWAQLRAAAGGLSTRLRRRTSSTVTLQPKETHET